MPRQPREVDEALVDELLALTIFAVGLFAWHRNFIASAFDLPFLLMGWASGLLAYYAARRQLPAFLLGFAALPIGVTLALVSKREHEP